MVLVFVDFFFFLDDVDVLLVLVLRLGIFGYLFEIKFECQLCSRAFFFSPPRLYFYRLEIPRNQPIMKYTIICSLLVSSSAHVLRTQTKPCTLIKYWGNVAKDCTDGKITGDLCTFANNCASGDATITTPTEPTEPTDPTEPSEAGCELVCAKDTCTGTQHHESLIHHIQHSNPIPYKEKWSKF